MQRDLRDTLIFYSWTTESWQWPTHKALLDIAGLNVYFPDQVEKVHVCTQIYIELLNTLKGLKPQSQIKHDNRKDHYVTDM